MLQRRLPTPIGSQNRKIFCFFQGPLHYSTLAFSTVLHDQKANCGKDERYLLSAPFGSYLHDIGRCPIIGHKDSSFWMWDLWVQMHVFMVSPDFGSVYLLRSNTLGLSSLPHLQIWSIVYPLLEMVLLNSCNVNFEYNHTL